MTPGLFTRLKEPSCKTCNPEADIPFDWLLLDVAQQKGLRAAWVHDVPNIKADVHEKTLVEPHGGIEATADTVA